MSVTTAHAAGTFCWPELSTSNVQAAKKFYSALLGWEPSDVPMPEDAGSYTMLKVGGNDVGAMASMQDAQKKAGVPPHWASFVAVTNADETVQKAVALDGTLMAGPFDVMDAGRMAVIKDPTGAIFSVWQAKSHPGATRINEVGALCWTELYTNDMDKAVAFYTSLFDWTGKPWDSPTPYTILTFKGQDKMAGGVLQMTKDMQGMPPHWLPYFQVEDTDKVVARAKELGGNVIVPPMDIPNVGRMATITDPQGAAFAVIKLPNA
jgi:predicted enzyme related to lactoylglutathione lyase